MLTKDEIQKKLEQDPDWSPDYDASDADWELYDTVLDEMEGSGSSDGNTSAGAFDLDDDDEDF